jgi:hypothetical protein
MSRARGGGEMGRFLVNECFECGSPADCRHHVVPRSRGGTATVPLCFRCHDKAHHKKRSMSTSGLTSAAMSHRRQEGFFVGGRLRYGWQAVEGRVVPHSGEQMTVARARELRAQGQTLTAVASALEAEGLLSRSGRRFTPTQIRRFCLHQSTTAPKATDYVEET